jgi:muconolactone delta-isomerase
MNEYMVTIQFLSFFSEEFASLLPGQRALVNELIENGIFTSYSLSLDRRILWITLYAESREDAGKILGTMPLFKFMRYDIVELMFHNSSVHASMRFSLN